MQTLKSNAVFKVSVTAIRALSRAKLFYVKVVGKYEDVERKI